MNRIERVTVADLHRVAELANLELAEDETVSMLRDLNSILDHIDQLSELDTSAIAPMAQVSEVLAHPPTTPVLEALRPDEVVQSLPHDRVMTSAPDSDGTFFCVPKVIER